MCTDDAEYFEINDEDDDENLLEEDDELFNALLKIIDENLPDNFIGKNNGMRYKTVMRAVEKLQKLVLEDDPDALFTCEPDPLLGTSLGVDIETVLFSISKMKEFCKILSLASSIEAMPLINGKVRVSITFDDVWKIIGAF